MWFFGKNAAANGPKAPAAPVRRFTRDLERAESLATMLANSRASEIVEVTDLLGGMYIDNWERLSRYWIEPEEIEAFFQQFCHLSPPRWQYWLQYHDEMRQASERKFFGLANLFRGNGKSSFHGRVYQRSLEFEEILAEAGRISPFRDRANGHDIPILTSESVLLAIAKNQELEISRKLRATGVDLNGLEREARFPRHAPRQ